MMNISGTMAMVATMKPLRPYSYSSLQKIACTRFLLTFTYGLPPGSSSMRSR